MLNVSDVARIFLQVVCKRLIWGSCRLKYCAVFSAVCPAGTNQNILTGAVSSLPCVVSQ